MSRDTRYLSKETQDPNKQPMHPIWRGIGCVLLIVIPFISYVAADYIITNARLFKWVVIPPEMIIYNFSEPLILVKLLYAAILVCILYLILTAITFLINRFAGAKRYGPYDVPLDKVKLDNFRRKK